jgi:hypothetical protein
MSYQVQYTVKKKKNLLVEKVKEFPDFIAANSYAKQIRYSEKEHVVGKPMIVEVE